MVTADARHRAGPVLGLPRRWRRQLRRRHQVPVPAAPGAAGHLLVPPLGLRPRRRRPHRLAAVGRRVAARDVVDLQAAHPARRGHPVGPGQRQLGRPDRPASARRWPPWSTRSATRRPAPAARPTATSGRCSPSPAAPRSPPPGAAPRGRRSAPPPTSSRPPPRPGPSRWPSSRWPSGTGRTTRGRPASRSTSSAAPSPTSRRVTPPSPTGTRSPWRSTPSAGRSASASPRSGATSAGCTRFRDAMSRDVGNAAYVNYVDPTLTDWQHAYYGANYPRLQRVKQHVRPRRRVPFPAVGPAGRLTRRTLVAAMNQRTYEVRTYGCQMNVHDSERLSGLLEDAGLRRAPPTATTGRRRRLQHLRGPGERRQPALRQPRPPARRSRTAHPGMQIAVGGCLAQKDRGEIVRRAPWVDVVFGTHNIGSLPVLLERARHNDEAQVEILESLEVFPSTLPTRRESAYAGLGVDLGRLQQHLHVLHRAGAARQGEGPPARRRPGRGRGAGRRGRARGHPARPERQLLRRRVRRPAARSASCCAPAARSTGSSGSGSPARTRGTSPTT